MTSSYESRLGTAPEEGVKAPVVTASGANLTLSGEQTVNGVAVTAGDRVLVRAQSDLTANGIYDASTGAWTRATDWNRANDVVNGVMIVDAGNGTLYQASFTGTFEVDVTEVTFPAIYVPERPDYLVVDTVAELKATSVVAGTRIDTLGYWSRGDGGHAMYEVVVSQSADGYVDHTISNGNVAKIMPEKGQLDFRQCGARANWNDGAGDNDAPALSAACTKCLTDNLILYVSPGEYGYAAETTITDTLRVRGAGPGLTRFRPLDGYAGGLFVIDNCWWEGGVALYGRGPSAYWIKNSDTSYNVALSGFSVSGKTYDSAGNPITEVQSGIRTNDRVDDIFMKDVRFENLTGTALSLGVHGTLGLIRESYFENVTIFRCGSTTNGYNCFEIGNGLSAGDGTNQLTFVRCDIVTNYAQAYIGNTIANPIRRIEFLSCMFHGMQNASDAQGCDVLTIEGNVDNVGMTGCKFNGSVNVSSVEYHCLVIQSAGGHTPADLDIDLDIRSCAGAGIEINGLSRSIIRGTSQVSSITGNELEVLSNGLTGFAALDYAVKGQTGVRTISVDASVRNLISAVYAGEADNPIRATSGAFKLDPEDSPTSVNTPGFYVGTGSPIGSVNGERRSLFFQASGDFDRSVDGLFLKYRGGNTSNTEWARLWYMIPGLTTGDFTDIDSKLNKQSKWEGMKMWNSTVKKYFNAQGSAAGDVWISEDGGTTLTPS